MITKILIIKNKPFTLFNNETGESFEIPVLSGTEGPKVLDIRNALIKKLVCLHMIQVLHQQLHVSSCNNLHRWR